MSILLLFAFGISFFGFVVSLFLLFRVLNPKNKR